MGQTPHFSLDMVCGLHYNRHLFRNFGLKFFSKLVETNEAVIKKFNTLDIPYGNYIIRTTIYYGDNQEATSEEAFTLSCNGKTHNVYFPGIEFELPFAKCGLQVMVRSS